MFFVAHIYISCLCVRITTVISKSRVISFLQSVNIIFVRFTIFPLTIQIYCVKMVILKTFPTMFFVNYFTYIFYYKLTWHNTLCGEQTAALCSSWFNNRFCILTPLYALISTIYIAVCLKMALYIALRHFTMSTATLRTITWITFWPTRFPKLRWGFGINIYIFLYTNVITSLYNFITLSVNFKLKLYYFWFIWGFSDLIQWLYINMFNFWHMYNEVVSFVE